MRYISYMENWKEVAVDARYEVSDMGRVRRITPAHGARVGRILSPQKGGKRGQYRRVALGGTGSCTRAYIHRLVCCAFHGPPPTDRHEVNHINSDPADNRVENLEWVTRGQNMQHAYDNGRKASPTKGSRHYLAKLTEDDVCEIRRAYAAGDSNQRELGEAYGILQTTVSRIVLRRSWKHI
jgi:hypothetical protein